LSHDPIHEPDGSHHAARQRVPNRINILVAFGSDGDQVIKQKTKIGLGKSADLFARWATDRPDFEKLHENACQ
jgi:hypothetical protein